MTSVSSRVLTQQMLLLLLARECERLVYIFLYPITGRFGIFFISNHWQIRQDSFAFVFSEFVKKTSHNRIYIFLLLIDFSNKHLDTFDMECFLQHQECPHSQIIMSTVCYFYFSFLVIPVSYVLLNRNINIKFSANDVFLDFNAKSFKSLDYDLKLMKRKLKRSIFQMLLLFVMWLNISPLNTQRILHGYPQMTCADV